MSLSKGYLAMSRPPWIVTTAGIALAIAVVFSGSLFAQNGLISASEAVNSQTGTSYTFFFSDLGKLVTFTNSSGISATLPTAGSAGFSAGWIVDIENLGAGVVTLTPQSGTIDGLSSLGITQNQGLRVVSDGANWKTQRGMGGGGGGNTYTSIATSTTPTFTRSSANQEWAFTVSTSNSTGTTSGLTSGDILTFNITQCATTGGCNFTWPTGFSEACTIANGNAFTGVANLGIKQTFYWDGSAAHAMTPCVTTASAPGAGILRGDTPSASELSGAVATSGSNVTTLQAGVVAPSNLSSVQGNGSKIQLSTGATTTNDCAKFDANGNTVDAGSGCGGSPTLQHVQVSISSAQIKTLHASPVTLVAAPGSGSMLQFVTATVEFVCSSCTTYTAGGNTNFSYSNGDFVSSTVSAGNFVVGPTADKQWTFLQSTNSAATVNWPNDERNLAIVLQNWQATEYATGTGTLLVDVWYTVTTGY